MASGKTKTSATRNLLDNTPKTSSIAKASNGQRRIFSVNEAKIRTLTVRPIISSDLSFNMPGIIYKRHGSAAKIGERVRATDLNRLYTELSEILPDGQQKYNSEEITTHLSNSALFVIRNEPLAAKVDQAIRRRHNAFLRKYKHIRRIAQLWSALYPSRRDQVIKLMQLHVERFTALNLAYQNQTNVGVTYPVSISQHTGKITSTTNMRPIGVSQGAQGITVKDSASNPVQSHDVGAVQTVPVAFAAGAWSPLQDTDTTFKSSVVTTDYETKPAGLDYRTHQLLAQAFTQISTDTNSDFRYPSKDNEIASARNQATLQEELFMHEVNNLQSADVEQILKNELLDLDLEVRGLQLNFVHTFLLSPIPGLITAVYKDAGESVVAGEPVLRVEDDSSILLVGAVRYRAALTVGTLVTVRTESVFESGDAIKLDGRIVAVRGHDADDDEWDVTIECINQAVKPDNTRVALPINYQFDKFTTTLTIN